ncbi:uncharacterized protein LOC114165332 [Vigna unguiculata]|uniref:uncharacterized protein LOC114165332 n=1 Tax=Vigna unguiculata TaxID=3917 RepID=UPI0010161C64|nr:uncharacterized protein LOC114165332 [Vigna unguiculata]
MACQCVGARLTSLSSPSQQNDTPTSIPTRSIQNVLQEDQHMSTDEAGEPSINEDDDLLFYPSRVASKAITKTLKQQYVEPWLTWGAMLDQEKEFFFQRFKASHRLSEIFMEARKTGKKTHWMFDRVWNSLLAKWNQPEFRSKSARNQKNRASEKGGCLHTGGSITIHEHALRMVEQLGRLIHFDELFHHTHVRKNTDDFEEFQTVFSQARSEVTSCGEGEEISLLDPGEEEKLRKKSWLVVAGGKNPMGRVYGVGKLNENYLCGEAFTQQPSSSTSMDSQKILRLEEEIHQSREEFRQSREENQRL